MDIKGELTLLFEMIRVHAAMILSGEDLFDEFRGVHHLNRLDLVVVLLKREKIKRATARQQLLKEEL